jgi:maleate isomerase
MTERQWEMPAAIGFPFARMRLRIIRPSSNTVLQPVVVRLGAGLPNLSLHFARFRMTEISLLKAGLKQFEIRNIVEAAQLLSDARMD